MTFSSQHGSLFEQNSEQFDLNPDFDVGPLPVCRIMEALVPFSETRRRQGFGLSATKSGKYVS